MITARIIGGLGNQMFQYAAARALALRTGDSVLLDRRAFKDYTVHGYALDAFSLPAEDASLRHIPLALGGSRESRFMPWRRPVSHVKEQGLRFDLSIYKAKGPIYLDGYWQSEKYFADQTTALRRDFTFRHAPSEVNATLMRQASSVNSVSVHVRRGDYVSNPSATAVHGVCPPSYYTAAFASLTALKGPDLVAFMFSDDQAWVREHIRLPARMVYVEGNGPDTAYEDLRLMASCQHHIIANSTFSWWGAWLDAKPDATIIAPARWFADLSMDATDIIPDRWIKIEPPSN